MRKSKLGIQALSPDGKALAWVKKYRPRIFKVVIVSPGDFVGWMTQIPEETFIVGRYFGDGNIDYLPWTPENGVMLADRIKTVHDMNHGRIDAWECVNEPVVHTVEAMQQLAEFQRVWALEMRAKGLSPIVGNFPRGNPATEAWNNLNLMQYFRPALEAGVFFGYHGYGCPKVLSDSPYLALRYRTLLAEAGIERPVILTEFGVDCGSTGHGYKERWTDEEYVAQLIKADQVLQADPLVWAAAIYCYGAWGWKTFDLTRNAARLVGEYIESQGDMEGEAEPEPEPEPGPQPEPEPSPPSPETDIGKWLLEGLDKHLPPWHERVEYNPYVALTLAAGAAKPPLGLPISRELRKRRGSQVFVHQFFWTGMAWCRENEYNNIRIVRY